MMVSNKRSTNSLPNTAFKELPGVCGEKSIPHDTREVLLRLRQVQAIFPVSKTTWYAGIKDGIYPSAVKLSRRSVAWKKSQIEELIVRCSNPSP